MWIASKKSSFKSIENGSFLKDLEKDDEVCMLETGKELRLVQDKNSMGERVSERYRDVERVSASEFVSVDFV